jgi:hypothetical protein
LIYTTPAPEEPIRQGDIFHSIPRMDFSLEEFTCLEEGKTVKRRWANYIEAASKSGVAAVVGVRAVTAIVITQDCDAVRSPDICLCEIMDFQQVERKAKDAKTPKGWVSIITQHCRINQKWYYLPMSAEIGFQRKMGVDFRAVIRISRDDLERMRGNYRRARLNDIALAHFRERIGEFFRRFPYDEWYPLDPDEFKVYTQNSIEPIKPYGWQK